MTQNKTQGQQSGLQKQFKYFIEWLELGVVKPANSLYNSPIFVSPINISLPQLRIGINALIHQQCYSIHWYYS